MRSKREEKMLCTKTSQAIAPFLLQKGFLKKRDCYIRIHGDKLLQIIGVRTIGQFGIYTYVYPLYDLFCDMIRPKSYTHNLIGLNNTPMLYGRSPEAIAGINEGVSMFVFQLHFDDVIHAEIELLHDVVFPRLEKCRSGCDAVSYNYDSRWPSESHCLAHNISMYLRDQEIEKSVQSIKAYITHVLSDMEYSNPDSRNLTSDEKLHELLNKACNVENQFEQDFSALNSLDISLLLYDAIQRDNRRLIDMKMQEATDKNVAYIKSLFHTQIHMA